MKNKVLILMLTIIISIFATMTLSSCNETDKQNNTETIVTNTIKTIETTVPQTAAIQTETPTENKKTNNEHYEFDENTYYSTPEGIFIKPATATNPDGEPVINNNNDSLTPKAK